MLGSLTKSVRWLAGLLAFALTACDGNTPTSSPVGATTPTPPPIETLRVTSGETHEPVAGAKVTVGARVYFADNEGYFTVDPSHNRDATVNVVAENFLVRDTLLYRGLGEGLALWPRTNPSGIDERFTRFIVYGGEDGDGYLSRWVVDEEVDVILLGSDDNPEYQDFGGRAQSVQRHAVLEINGAMAGLVRYKEPVPGPDVEREGTVRLRIRRDDYCAEGPWWAWAQTNGHRISSALVNYCEPSAAEDLGASIHELAHTLGLGHSPDRSDIMGGRVFAFSEREKVTLRLMMRREPQNRFPDTDLFVRKTGRHDPRLLFRCPR